MQNNLDPSGLDMAKKQLKKKYVVRKYVFATSVKHAMAIEKQFCADEVFFDEAWQKANEESEQKPWGVK